MKIGLLGSVEAWHDGRPIDLGSPRQRSVLAMLALEPGRIVSVDRLVDTLWDGEPPTGARRVLQTYTSRLRVALRPAGVALTRRPPGYLLDLPDAEVDLHLFRSLAAAGSAEALTGALRLWRGSPLANLPEGLLDRVRVDLAEEWATVREEYLHTRIEAGRHLEHLAELRQFAAEFPLRDRPLSLLMLGLHRAGRQAEALEAYQDARRFRAETLGLDPGRELADLHSRILADDAGLAAGPAPRRVVPRSLPLGLPDFTGRTTETAVLADLAARATDAVVVAAIGGMPGIGKTTTAVQAAQALSGRFPDGQLFVDLHGYTAGRRPVDSAVALGVLLRSLGVSERDVPADADERAARWRTELAGRRALVLLDNAADAEQVRPLLPGTPGVLVLITSRGDLSAVDGVTPLPLDVLPSDDARALLTAMLGPRVDAEPDATAELLRLCGHLPLALRIAAARLRGRPEWSVARLVDRLRAEHHRLPELALGDRGVEAAFTLSYTGLPLPARRLYRLLGTHPGTHFAPSSVAALAATAAPTAERLLEQLRDAHLLQPHGPDRYAFHDLLRVFAAGRAAAEETAPERHAALARLLDHYVEASRRAVRDAGFGSGAVPAGRESALAWLDAERATLVAAAEHAVDAGLGRYARDLSLALYRYLDEHCHYHDATALHLSGQRAVPADGRILRLLALTDLGLGAVDRGGERAARALELCSAAGDRAGEGLALELTGRFSLMRGALDRAVGELGAALDLHRSVGDLAAEATCLINLGTGYGMLGDLPRAAGHLQRGLTLCRTTGSRSAEAAALASLGIVHQRLGQYAEATDRLEQALDLHRAAGRRNGEANALSNLGFVYSRMGRYEQAVRHFDEARRLHRETGNRVSEGRALCGLGRAYHGLGRPDLARGHVEHGLALSRELGERILETQALVDLGRINLADGRTELATGQVTAAAALATANGDRYGLAQAEEGLGEVLDAVGDPGAGGHWRRALELYTGLGVPEAAELSARLGRPAGEPAGPEQAAGPAVDHR
ncbi:tetratricopeptide repeat protein [Longispora urticae]